MNKLRKTVLPVTAIATAMLLAACGGSNGGDAASVASATPAATVTQPAIDDCARENLTTVESGVLTIGTDSPAYPPYFVDDDPTTGEGFESAVAYAIADGLGFAANEVNWVVVPFNSSYAPGDKSFDFDVNQISITPERAKVVDFSDGYYTVNQAVVALNDSPIANATSVDELRNARLGAQIGTTSLDFINEVVQPTADVQVFNDTNDAKSAMNNGQVDGIVVDLPTAFYVTAVEIENSKIVGQFKAQEGGEEFGLLFAKGNPLVTCVNRVLADLKTSGELQAIQDKWLAGQQAPYFTE